MRCGLLKLSRILREGSSKRRPLCGTSLPARSRVERAVRRRPAGEHPSLSAGAEHELELAEWTVRLTTYRSGSF
jgi:hypothetical protein